MNKSTYNTKDWKQYRLSPEADAIISAKAVKEYMENGKQYSKQQWLDKTIRNLDK